LSYDDLRTAMGAAGAAKGGLELEEPPPQPEMIVETAKGQKSILNL
jgi:hypothetical protein